MLILLQFVLRTSFGLAAAMAVTPPRAVTSGYYRNNLHVLLGLNVLATLVSLAMPHEAAPPLWLPALAVALSYVGSVLWLAERPRAGIAALVLLAATVGAAAVASWNPASREGLSAEALRAWDPLASGFLLGAVLAAMLLGHWHLNAPGMELFPLKRLILLMGAAILVRTLGCGWGLWLETSSGPLEPAQWMFLALRWLAGLAGTLATAILAWQTLKVPNTQSATGILYVGVMGAFVGELASLLLSSESTYPL